KFVFADIGNFRFHRQFDLWYDESVVLFVDKDRRSRIDARRFITRVSERERERHRKTRGMSRRDQLFGICVLYVVPEPRTERIRPLERAAAKLNAAAAFFYAAFPMCLRCSFNCHDLLLYELY